MLTSIHDKVKVVNTGILLICTNKLATLILTLNKPV